MAPIPSSSTSNPGHVQQACKEHAITQTEFEGLHSRSVAAKAAAYCPYSKFRVGCAVLSSSSTRPELSGSGGEIGKKDEKPSRPNLGESSDTGVFFSGANVENASYPVGTCAERVALARGVIEGHHRFRAVAVATDIEPPASPCGMCRQFIREFCDPDTPIFMFDKNSNFVVLTLNDLLPMSFGPEMLPPPV